MASIHCGDIHLKIPEKNEEFYINRFLSFTEKIKEEDPDEIIITGDLFDKSPTALESALLLGWLHSFECKVLVVEGNHDRTNRKNIRANYLEALLTLVSSSNIKFCGKELIEFNSYVLVSNRMIREGFKIPVNKDKILLSHIRHELEFAGTKKKAEYNLKELEGFQCCLLSDIHSTFQYSDNIFYSSSPWRTHKQTISSIEEINDKFFGYNLIDQGTITHVECNLPNHYVLKTSEKIDKLEYRGIVDIEYEISIDDLDRFSGENVKIRHIDSDIKVQENLYELVYSILEEEYQIKEPKKYMDLLVEVVGEI